ILMKNPRMDSNFPGKHVCRRDAHHIAEVNEITHSVPVPMGAACVAAASTPGAKCVAASTRYLIETCSFKEHGILLGAVGKTADSGMEIVSKHNVPAGNHGVE